MLAVGTEKSRPSYVLVDFTTACSWFFCEQFSFMKAFIHMQAFQRANARKVVGNFSAVMECSCGCSRKCLYLRKQDEGWRHRKENWFGSGKVY